MNEKLHQLLAQLRLKGFAGALDQEIQKAEKEATPISASSIGSRGPRSPWIGPLKPSLLTNSQE